MQPTDPERERQRLVEEYSNMPDAKLEELAADDSELTDAARTTLKDEMERRGLRLDIEPIPTAAEESPVPDFVTIRTFKSFNEALLAKGLLESCGIDCFIADENMARVETGWAIGIRLQVKQEDADAATEILDQPIPDEPEDKE